jgi:hypothetical protein
MLRRIGAIAEALPTYAEHNEAEAKKKILAFLSAGAAQIHALFFESREAAHERLRMKGELSLKVERIGWPECSDPRSVQDPAFLIGELTGEGGCHSYANTRRFSSRT